MARGASRRRKHTPHRTCVACGAVRPKRDLIRVVRTPDGRVLVDERGKQDGRGAYLCAQRACWERALVKRQLERALRIGIDEKAASELRAYAGGLPERLEVEED